MDLHELSRVDRCRNMDELINFEPDPDYSPDAGTGLLSPISFQRCYNFTSGKSDVYVGLLAAAARSAFNMVLFTEPVSRRNTFVGGKCAPPSALLVVNLSSPTMNP